VSYTSRAHPRAARDASAAAARRPGSEDFRSGLFGGIKVRNRILHPINPPQHRDYFLVSIIFQGEG